jgi:hypothetical protein
MAMVGCGSFTYPLQKNAEDTYYHQGIQPALQKSLVHLRVSLNLDSFYGS